MNPPQMNIDGSDPDANRDIDREDEEPALADAQRQLVRDRLIRASRRVCAQRGLDVRMEDVAQEAGVSRRTAFRYFPNRSELIREAFASGMQNYRLKVSEQPTDADPRTWLEGVFLRTHRLNASVGKLFWDLTFSPIDDPELAKLVNLHHASRKDFVGSIASAAWVAFGGTGSPPDWLVDAIAVQLSAFTTEALMSGYGRTPAEIGTSASNVVALLIEAALTSQSSGKK